MPFGAYCTLIEYQLDAYLPINEVATGWIKNIREFIKEGQTDVAKVIFVDKDKKAVDISLKQVSTKEKKDTLNAYAAEKRAEQLFKQALLQANLQSSEQEIRHKLAQKYMLFIDVIEDAYKSKDALKGVVGQELSEILHEIAVKNIKPKVYEVSYRIELSAKNRKGNIHKIKDALGEAEKQGIKIIYEGAPHYLAKADGSTYPEAESKIKAMLALLDKYKDTLNINVSKVE